MTLMTPKFRASRLRLAMESTDPDEVASLIASSKKPDLVAAAVLNPVCPESSVRAVALRFAEASKKAPGQSYEIGRAVIGAPNTTTEAIMVLLEAGESAWLTVGFELLDGTVPDSLCTAPLVDRIAECVRTYDRAEIRDFRLAAVAVRPHASEATLIELAKAAGERTADALGTRSDLPLSVVRALIDNPNVDGDNSGFSLLSRHSTNPDVLDALAAADSPPIANRAALNPNARRTAMGIVARRYPHWLSPSTSRRWVEYWLGVAEGNTAARDMLLGIDEWYDLTKDSPEVQLALSLHPTP